MKKFFLAILIAPLLLFSSRDPIAVHIQQITAEIGNNARLYDDLRELTTLGPRLSGGEGAERAVTWAKAKMESYGFDGVRLQKAMVPHWTRGTEESLLIAESQTSLKVTALGGSVGTSGITAQVVEVKSLADVDALGEAVRGKIVFYNQPMDLSLPDTFSAYGRVVDRRTSGPSRAAKYGAVATLVRSLSTLPDDDHPHTGVLYYKEGIAQIPAAAISTHGANVLSAALTQNPSLSLILKLSCEQHPDIESYNVIGELKGSELPSEIVLVGGHLDSWDLGTGAHDDGAGAVQSIEVLRSLKASGIPLKRTVRAVLFMAEEFGGYGADEYAIQAKANGEHHLAALESDRGGFAPVGFETDAGDAIFGIVSDWKPYLSSVKAEKLFKGGSGTDVEPLQALGTATFGFVPESKHYFDYHHSALDQISIVDRKELLDGSAAMAVFIYLVTEKGL